MFSKLKEKLKNWTQKISSKAEVVEDVAEEKIIQESKNDNIEQKKEKSFNKKIKKQEDVGGLVEDISKEECDDEEIVESSFIEDKRKFKNEEKAELKKPDDVKEVEMPMKFDIALQKHEPDIDKLKEIQEDVVINEKLPDIKEDRKSFFHKITSKIQKVKITEKDFDVYAEELEMLLLENNVAYEIAEKMIKQLRDGIVGKEILKKEVESEIKDLFKEIINEILIEPFSVVSKVKEKTPYVILFCGINGSGKTTTIAKIAQQLKENDLTCVMAAADTFRAASIEQIKKHGARLDVNVISHEYGSDPASVGFDAIKYAEKNNIDCVLIDTAGRIHTDKNLMKQIEKINKVCKPDLKIFIGESITGNDAIEQVKSFDWAIGVDGIILSKADIDDKGGTALSVGYVTKKPILYLGTGQEYEKIEVFDKDKFIEKLGL